MRATPRLLDHPLYAAWERGEISREDMAVFHRSHADLIQNIPRYWQRVVNAFRPDDQSGMRIVQEERDHILLWEAWGRDFLPPDDFPRLQEALFTFENMTASELLGALQAFETQMPEVSRTMNRALTRHYGFSGRTLAYFEQHMLEEPHIAYGSWLAYRFADRREFDAGYQNGAEIIYRTLEPFYPPGVIVQ